jgi:hypothetical protein
LTRSRRRPSRASPGPRSRSGACARLKQFHAPLVDRRAADPGRLDADRALASKSHPGSRDVVEVRRGEWRRWRGLRWRGRRRGRVRAPQRAAGAGNPLARGSMRLATRTRQHGWYLLSAILPSAGVAGQHFAGVARREPHGWLRPRGHSPDRSRGQGLSARVRRSRSLARGGARGERARTDDRALRRRFARGLSHHGGPGTGAGRRSRGLASRRRPASATRR